MQGRRRVIESRRPESRTVSIPVCISLQVAQARPLESFLALCPIRAAFGPSIQLATCQCLIASTVITAFTGDRKRYTPFYWLFTHCLVRKRTSAVSGMTVSICIYVRLTDLHMVDKYHDMRSIRYARGCQCTDSYAEPGRLKAQKEAGEWTVCFGLHHRGGPLPLSTAEYECLQFVTGTTGARGPILDLTVCRGVVRCPIDLADTANLSVNPFAGSVSLRLGGRNWPK